MCSSDLTIVVSFAQAKSAGAGRIGDAPRSVGAAAAARSGRAGRAAKVRGRTVRPADAAGEQRSVTGMRMAVDMLGVSATAPPSTKPQHPHAGQLQAPPAGKAQVKHVLTHMRGSS
jgi:hypothetical protein